jgi:hypothetical protein
LDRQTGQAGKKLIRREGQTEEAQKKMMEGQTLKI